ncbi:hypothetical protein DTO169E5_1981 [Paecilomyces variotii]|nr:hypothetical protein DTO169E5_1981 [Paecilomyces variotii]
MSPISRKRTADALENTTPNSKAAKFNLHTLNRLKAAIDNDPEIDLMSQMPIDYSGRLAEMKRSADDTLGQVNSLSRKTKKLSRTDIRDRLSASDSLETVFPLSELVLQGLEQTSTTTAPLPDGLPERLVEFLQKSEVLWTASSACHKAVLKCTDKIAVKIVHGIDDYTEYTTLQYLQRHKPTVPAPRPLGLVRMNDMSLIFMSYKPSVTLGKVWNKLRRDQKASIGDQLNHVFMDLRSIPYEEGLQFGGVAGEGCKDVRRGLRRSERPITSVDDFEHFLFSGPNPGGDILIKILFALYPKEEPSPNIVFTHGDVRPDNITVEIVDGDRYVVSGILDWEYSGFYPEYFEAIRSTNCLAPCESYDWYLYLPDCFSPKRYAHWWLLDRVRETIFM